MKCNRCQKAVESNTCKWADVYGRISRGCDYMYAYCPDCKPRNIVAEERDKQEQILNSFYGNKKAP